MKVSFLLFFIGFSSLANSNIEYREVEIVTETEDKNEAIRQAVDQVSREFVKSLIGEKKYQKNQENIEGKVIKNKDHYILVTRTKPPIAQEDGKFMTKVTLGFSKKNLKAVLLEHNLYYSSNQVLCLLPVLYFETYEEKKLKYTWWKESLKNRKFFPQDVASSFYKHLSSYLIRSGFYVIDPVFSRVYDGVPSAILPSGKRVSQFVKLADFLHCNLIMSGKVVLKQISANPKSYLSQVSFKVFNTQTKAVLFELKKKIPLVHLDERFESELEPIFKSLNYQLSSYKQSGSLELNRLFLHVQGILKYYEKEKLRKILIRKIPSIKDLKERVITSQKIIYEVDSSENISSLLKRLKSIKISQFLIQVTNYNKKQLEIYVQPINKKQNSK